jgi:hypothetical protein
MAGKIEIIMKKRLLAILRTLSDQDRKDMVDELMQVVRVVSSGKRKSSFASPSKHPKLQLPNCFFTKN